MALLAIKYEQTPVLTLHSHTHTHTPNNLAVVIQYIEMVRMAAAAYAHDKIDSLSVERMRFELYAAAFVTYEYF